MTSRRDVIKAGAIAAMAGALPSSVTFADPLPTGPTTTVRDKTGTDALLPGSAACSASTRCFTASISAWLLVPKFDAYDAPALYAFVELGLERHASTDTPQAA